MIRYLRLVVIGLLGLSLLTVALANRAPVEVRLLPGDLAALTGLTWAMELPLFLVIFAGILAGVLIGFVWEWLRETGIRSTASAKAREVARLERELAALRGRNDQGEQDDVLALLDRPSGK
ncbi:LapA family protein [Tabrizicola piscis]|jgi:putative membrane protein|uniref:LapA family protein n=1 Tax=Tabrizicola piscis TaxID=2494374 RepID=A0A3S8U4C0_9RHOB|nr:LapA family protein [Tabrizicola piscis]AZL58441.1 LapA family protein [Tabrizicola piscis]